MASTPPAPAVSRVVLLTGASSGIGRATAIEFARHGGVHLLLVARRLDELERTIELARAGAAGDVEFEACTCDLADDGDVERLVAEVVERVGRLDVLVNNAGAGMAAPFEEAGAMDDVDRVLALNLRAPIALVAGLFQLLTASRGTIVNVSSVAGLVGTPGSPVYSATKWGLTGFTEATRARYAKHGIRVFCVQPGPVPTPGFPHLRLQGHPVRRRLLACDADAIARAIVRAARGRGRASVVLPRSYAPIPLIRGVAPWLVRRLLTSGAARNATSASSIVPTGTPAP